jgi:hypothetical protein
MLRDYGRKSWDPRVPIVCYSCALVQTAIGAERALLLPCASGTIFSALTKTILLYRYTQLRCQPLFSVRKVAIQIVGVLIAAA